MSPEQPPREEGDAEVIRVPVDSSLFTMPDEYLERVEDEKRREELRGFIIRGREGALRYVIWLLGQMTGTEEGSFGEETEREIREDQTHGLQQALSYVTLILAKMGGPSFAVPENRLERENLWARAAVGYAATTLEKFRQELEVTGDPEKAAAAVGIQDVDLLSKLSEAESKLPPGVIFGK